MLNMPVNLAACLLLLVSVALCNKAQAAEISLQVRFSPSKERQIQGKMLIKRAEMQGDELCFYLPMNDPEVEYNPQKLYNLFQDKYAVRRRNPGSIEITNVTGAKVESYYPSDAARHVVKLKVEPAAELLVSFETKLPRWPNAKKEQWQAIHFHPLPMTTCNEPKLAAFRTAVRNKYRVQLQYPANMAVASNAVEISTGRPIGAFRQRIYEFAGESIAFSLGTTLQRKIIRQNKFYLEVFYRSETFLGLIEPLLDILNYHAELYGALPYKKLALIESQDLESSEIPGMMVINQPENASSTGVQQFFTNWTVWQLSYLASEQWLGTAIKARSMDDYWFFKGSNDFAAYRALKRVKEGFDFFKSYENKPPRFTFNYRQGQDLTAVLLNFFQYRNQLVDKQVKTLRASDDQHPLSYIRHSVAMRQVNWALGDEKFAAILREFVRSKKFQRVTPANFLETPNLSATAGTKQKWQLYFKKWWTTREWPDFYIDDIVKKTLPGDIYQVEVFVREQADFDFPLNIEVIDSDGISYNQIVSKSNAGLWKGTFHLRSPLKSVYLDPEKEIFDWDRFNNSNTFGNFYLFPGSARTLYDEDYTVVWLPMLGKLPGDSLTFYLTAQFLRYIHDGLTTVLNYSPDNNRFGLFLMYETLIPSIGGLGLFSLEQDSAINRDERIAELVVRKEPFLSVSPMLSLQLILRHRQLIAKTETGHEVFGVGLGVRPLNRRFCNYLFTSRAEQTFSSREGDINYDRYWFNLEGNCQISQSLDVVGRYFQAELNSDDFSTLPENVYFRPQNVSEARVRIPTPRLDGMTDLRVISAEALLPANLGIAGIAVENQMRWRLFYDYARPVKGEGDIRAAGLGLYMPLGGDVVGKGGISFLRFSLLYVPYVRLADGEKGKSGVLFDFFGSL